MPRLSFLPDVDAEGKLGDAELVAQLHRVLFDPQVGGWVPVDGLLGEGCWLPRPGLVINPTADAARRALTRALEQAMVERSTLLIWYVGHGYGIDQAGTGRSRRHLLQVRDTHELPYDSHQTCGFDPYEMVRDRLGAMADRTVGIVMVIDACHASYANEAVSSWKDHRGRLRSVWLASSADSVAYDGCMTRELIARFTTGVNRATHPVAGTLTPVLRAGDVAPLLAAACRRQTPTLGGFQYADPAMFLARNRPADERLERLGLTQSEGALMLSLRAHLIDVEHRKRFATTSSPGLTVVTGPSGSGKSVLVAALREPPETDPQRVDAAAFAGMLAHDPEEVAASLLRQLSTAQRFRDAVDAERAAIGTDAWAAMTAAGRLSAALSRSHDLWRVAIDDVPASSPVAHLVDDLAAIKNLATLITTRDPHVDAWPRAEHVLRIGRPDDRTCRTYLAQRNITDDALIDHIIAMADRSWVVLRLAADRASDTSAIFADALTPSALYDQLFERARQRHPDGAAAAVVAALAAAGSNGPVVPLSLVAGVVAQVEGPNEPAELLSVLADPDLAEIIERSRPGTATEHLGLFHPTVIEWAANHHHVGPVATQSRAALLVAVIEWGQRGEELLSSGAVREALGVHREEVRLLRGVLEQAPDRATARGLAIGLGRLGQALWSSGEAGSAVGVHREEVGLKRHLHEQAPDRATARDLAIGLGSLGQALRSSGEAGSAVGVHREEVGLVRELHEQAPDRATARELAIGLGRLAAALRHAGEGAEAERAHEEASRVRERDTAS